MSLPDLRQPAAPELAPALLRRRGRPARALPEVEEPRSPRDRAVDFGHRVMELVPLHPLGWTTLAVGLACLLVGLATAWWELRLVGVFALALVVIALGFTLGRPDYRVRITLGDDRLLEGEQASGGLVVHNAGRRSLPTRLDLPIGPHQATLRLPALGAGAEHEEQFTIPTERRGVVHIGPASTVQGDPLSLAGRTSRWTERATVWVHPRTVPLPGGTAGLVHDLEGRTSQQLTSSDMDFHALREYAPGDDRRQVHWRSSARAGTLLVRQYAETRQARLALALDLARESYLDDEEFELAVRAAGSIGLQSLREGYPISLVSEQQLLVNPHPRRLLDELSAVQLGEARGPRELAREVMRRCPSASVVALVTGSALRTVDLGRHLSAVPAEVRVVTVQVDPSATTAVSSIGRMSTIRLPELAELPRAMRKASA